MLSPSGYSALDESEDFELSQVPSRSDPGAESVQNSTNNSPRSSNTETTPEVSSIKYESMCQIAMEMLLPFLFAGVGMVLAGLLLDNVQVRQKNMFS
jgi:hypothetical protein